MTRRRLAPVMASRQKWSIGEFVTVIDPDSPSYGRIARVTGLTPGGAVSVRFGGWTYGTFDSRHLRHVTEHPGDGEDERST